MAKQNSFGFNVPSQVHADDPPIPEWRKDATGKEEIKEMADFVEGYRESSREAYRELKDTGQLNKQEVIIFRALNNKPPMTGREIQKATGMDINAVSGRVNDLKKKKGLYMRKMNDRKYCIMCIVG